MENYLWIVIKKQKKLSFCFTDYNLNILSPEEYIKWDMDRSLKSFKEENIEEYNICKNNIKFLNKNAKLMNKEELRNFINQDYSKQIGESNFKKFLKEFIEKGMEHNTYWQFKIEKTDDKDSWEFYEKESKNVMMKYDNYTKKLEINDYFNTRFYKGIIQDVNDYYGVKYKEENGEKHIINEEKEDEINYDFE